MTRTTEWHKTHRADIMYFQRRALEQKMAALREESRAASLHRTVRLEDQKPPTLNFRDWREALKARRLQQARSPSR